MKHTIRFDASASALMVLALVTFGCGGGTLATSGNDSVYQAAENGDIAEVSLEIRKGSFRVDTPDGNGKTLLHHAVIGNQYDAVAKLVDEYGADVDAQDAEGLTPLAYAEQTGNEEIVALLRDAGGG